MESHGNTDYDEIDMVDHEAFAMRRGNPQTSNLHMTQQMTTKVAPAYDGRSNFFAFEDAIDDWRDITELEPEKRGPALRNRLEGGASQYKILLDRELLRDPNEGVNYFKRFLRPHFIKGAQTVFLYPHTHSIHLLLAIHLHILLLPPCESGLFFCLCLGP